MPDELYSDGGEFKLFDIQARLEEAVKRASEKFIKYFKRRPYPGDRVLQSMAKTIAEGIGDVFRYSKFDVVSRIITEKEVTDDIKVTFEYDPKRRMYTVIISFKDDHLAKKVYVFVVKFAEQLSKPLVPSQIEKYKRTAQDGVHKVLRYVFRGGWRHIKYDMTLILLGYKYTPGCMDTVRVLNEQEKGKTDRRVFMYLVRFDRPEEALERVADFFMYRAGNAVLSFYNRYKEAMREWGEWIPEKVKNTVSGLLKLYYRIRGLLGYKVPSDDEIDQTTVKMIKQGVSLGTLQIMEAF